jgi:hypothetical protein
MAFLIQWYIIICGKFGNPGWDFQIVGRLGVNRNMIVFVEDVVLFSKRDIDDWWFRKVKYFDRGTLFS